MGRKKVKSVKYSTGGMGRNERREESGRRGGEGGRGGGSKNWSESAITGLAKQMKEMRGNRSREAG